MTKKHSVYYSPISCSTKEECLQHVKEIQRSLLKENLTPEEIIALTDSGYTVAFGGNKNNWSGQSLFGIDIDQLQNITIKQLITRLTRKKLPPFAVFSTLGNQDTANPTRIRLYFAVNEVIHDYQLMYNIIHFICDTVTQLSSDRSVDYQCMNTGRLFFPGHIIYRAPQKKILAKNIVPLASILYSSNTFLVNRKKIIEELQNKWISGTTYLSPKGISDFILLHLEQNHNSLSTIKFFELQNSSLLTCPIDTKPYRDDYVYPTTYISLSGGIIDINNKTLGSSNAQKSTRPRLYLAKVNSLYQNLFLANLTSVLSASLNTELLSFDSMKKDSRNLTILAQAFHIKFYSVSKHQILQNLQEYRKTLAGDLLKTNTVLSKLLHTSNRITVLSNIIEEACENVFSWKVRTVNNSVQYVLSSSILLGKQNKNDTASARAKIKEAINLFDTLHLLSIVPSNSYNNTIGLTKYKEQPIVIEIPWFDSALLTHAEYQAVKFSKEKRTIHNLGKINTFHNKTYQAVKNCVIHLLNIKKYCTRSMLIKLIEEENICRQGCTGNYIVDRYFPSVVKELKLCRDNYTKSLAKQILFPDESLTIGASILYHQGDLLI